MKSFKEVIPLEFDQEIIDTIIEYRITYLPKHIIQLIEAKVEDPFDIEGIEKPTMNIVAYSDLKSYLLDKITSHSEGII